MNDILYCPLDLPPVPKELTVELAELLYDYIPNFNEKQIAYLRSKNQVNAYTWKLIKLHIEQGSSPSDIVSGPEIERWKNRENQWEWSVKAKQYTPKLIEYIEKYLPFDNLKYIVILNSTGIVDEHLDIPPGISEEMKSNLLTTEPSQYRLLLDGAISNSSFYIKNEKVGKRYTELPPSSPGWAMGAYTCLHGNDESKDNQKLLCFINGNLNLEKHKELISASYNKYKKYAITNC
jgi:hypothetical protein